MKLYIRRCHHCDSKIPLEIKAPTRAHLRHRYGEHFNVRCPVCHRVNSYTPSNVFAESDSNSTAGGGVVGGLIGLLGGPVGALIGAGIGTAIGSSSDNEDKEKVIRFNRSH